MEFIKESSILQELMQEGFEQGERKATTEVLHKILTIRFDLDLDKFDEEFERLDIEALKKLSEVALTVQSPAEFEKALADILLKM